MSLRIWLPLIDNINNYGVSEYKTTMAGATLPTVEGKIGPAYKFGSGSESTSTRGISLDTNLVGKLGSRFSIACWVKPYGNHVHYNGTIFSSGNWNNNCWAFGLSQNNSKVDVFGHGFNRWIDCTVPVNTWTHLVSINNNGTCSLYKNGVFIGTLSDSATLVSDATNCCVGRETYANGYFCFNGAIQDLRIYDHCLSIDEIKEINKALVLHYPLDQYNRSANLFTKSTSMTSLVSSSIQRANSIRGVEITGNASTFSARVYDLGLQANKTYTVSFWVSASKSGKIRADICDVHAGDKINIGKSKVFYKGTTTISSVVAYTGFCDFNISEMDSGGTVYISNLKIEEGSNAAAWCPAIADDPERSDLIEYDCSGYNRHGTVTDSTKPKLVNGGPRNDNCYQFDGTDDVIVSPVKQTDILSDKKFTISAWVYLTEFKNNRGVLGPHENNYCGICFCQADNANRISLSFGNGSSWCSIRDTSYSLNTWAHYVMTYDGAKMIVYRNGVKLGESSGSIVFATNNITIGRAYNESTRYWKGKISDVRIYASALSADDVLELYRTSQKIDKKGNFTSYDFSEV